MSKKHRILFIALLIFAYLVCLIAYLPAQQVLYRLPKQLGVSANNVTGTLWSGHADTLRYKQVAMTNVDWTLSFLPLLLGKLSLDIDAGNPRAPSLISANGHITLSSSKLSTERLSVYAPTNTLASLFGRNLAVSPFGRTVINLDNANIAFDGTCKSVSGDVQWLNSEVHSDFGNVTLGNFEGRLGCDTQRATLSVGEPNQLGLTALITHQANQTLSIKGKMKPNDDLPVKVKRALQFLGEPDKNGYLPIDF